MCWVCECLCLFSQWALWPGPQVCRTVIGTYPRGQDHQSEGDEGAGGYQTAKASLCPCYLLYAQLYPACRSLVPRTRHPRTPQQQPTAPIPPFTLFLLSWFMGTFPWQQPLAAQWHACVHAHAHTHTECETHSLHTHNKHLCAPIFFYTKSIKRIYI